MARVARQVHDALLVEARGIAAAMRTEPVRGGDWERVEAQWKALEAAAAAGLRNARQARVDIEEQIRLTVPNTKAGLRFLAEDLGMYVAPFEGYTALKERVIEELRERAREEAR